jgi:hypothetical protein
MTCLKNGHAGLRRALRARSGLGMTTGFLPLLHALMSEPLARPYVIVTESGTVVCERAVGSFAYYQ